MTFANETLLPGETDGRSAARRIKMHEFLMTGGLQTGYDKSGKMTYGPPIEIATDPVCPWHGDPCWAWIEIVEGRGEWTRLEAELSQAETLRAGLDPVKDITEIEVVDFEIAKLNDKLEMRPRDAKALRDRTPAQVEDERSAIKRAAAKARADFQSIAKAAQKIAEGQLHAPNWRLTTEHGWKVYCTAHKPAVQREDDEWARVPAGRSKCGECTFDSAEPKRPVYAAAGPKTGGNPWDKSSKSSYSPPSMLPKYGSKVNYSTGEVFEAEVDSRDEAINAFASESVPDTIEIEGDEGEEGDED